MDFEDIVDMDWLNSHTTDPCLPSPPLVLKQEFAEMPSNSTDPSLFNTNNNSDPSEFMDYQPSSAKDMLVMPSIEQIKQLIEIAKKQLALREQPASVSSIPSNINPEPTPEPESPLSLPTVQETPSLMQLEELFAEENKDNDVIPETVSPESLIKTEEMSIPEEIKRDLLQEESCISLESYAETGGIDIKKLSSKERRQLRNKISARNFRVRRKEYIITLEGQVNDHKRSNEKLMDRLNTVEEENKQLRLQVDSLKRQNQQLEATTITTTNIENDFCSPKSIMITSVE